MDRTVPAYTEADKWIQSRRFLRFRQAFSEFEEENFTTGHVLKQKDLKRLQRKAKLPLVGEVYNPTEISDASSRGQGSQSTVKVLPFSPWTHFHFSARLTKLFRDFVHIKFVPGIVHYQSDRIHYDDYQALRILKSLCVSTVGTNLSIEEQRDLSSDLTGTFICAGGPVSNAISRLTMQYAKKDCDPHTGLLRTVEPIIALRYEPIYDKDYVVSKAGYCARFVDKQLHRVPNWFIRDTESSELLIPRTCHDRDLLSRDFLLISVLPNILDKDSYDWGDKIHIFGGTHGVGTQAIELVCSNNKLIAEILSRVGHMEYWQVLLEIDAIEHDEEHSRPISLSSNVRYSEVTTNGAALAQWFGESKSRRSKISHRPRVIRTGDVQPTESRVPVPSRPDSENIGAPEEEIAVTTKRPARPEAVEGFKDFNDPPLWGQDPKELERRFGVRIKVYGDKPDEFTGAYTIRVWGSDEGVNAFRAEYLRHPPPCLTHE